MCENFDYELKVTNILVEAFFDPHDWPRKLIKQETNSIGNWLSVNQLD